MRRDIRRRVFCRMISPAWRRRIGSGPLAAAVGRQREPLALVHEFRSGVVLDDLVHTHRVGIKYKKPPRLAPTEFSQWLVHTVANVDGASAYEPIAIHEHQRSAAARTRLR